MSIGGFLGSPGTVAHLISGIPNSVFDGIQTTDAVIGLSAAGLAVSAAVAARIRHNQIHGVTAVDLRDEDWKPGDPSDAATEGRVNRLLDIDEWGWRRNVSGPFNLKRCAEESQFSSSPLMTSYTIPANKTLLRHIRAIDQFIADESVAEVKRFLHRDLSAALDNFHITYLVNAYLPPLSAEMNRLPGFTGRSLKADLSMYITRINQVRLLNRPLLLELGDLNVILSNFPASDETNIAVRHRVRATLRQFSRGNDGSDSKTTRFRLARHCTGKAPVETIVKEIEEALDDEIKIYESYLAPDDGDPVEETLRKRSLWKHCRDAWYEHAPEGRKVRLPLVPNKAALKPRARAS